MGDHGEYWRNGASGCAYSIVGSLDTCPLSIKMDRIRQPVLIWLKLRWLALTQIAKFMGLTWGPPGSYRSQMGPMLAPWTLLSGELTLRMITSLCCRGCCYCIITTDGNTNLCIPTQVAMTSSDKCLFETKYVSHFGGRVCVIVFVKWGEFRRREWKRQRKRDKETKTEKDREIFKYISPS